MAKSNSPNPVRKGILPNKGTAKAKRGSAPSPIKKTKGRKTNC